jgi:hypothetical protein
MQSGDTFVVRIDPQSFNAAIESEEYVIDLDPSPAFAIKISEGVQGPQGQQGPPGPAGSGVSLGLAAGLAIALG